MLVSGSVPVCLKHLSKIQFQFHAEKKDHGEIFQAYKFGDTSSYESNCLMVQRSY